MSCVLSRRAALGAAMGLAFVPPSQAHEYTAGPLRILHPWSRDARAGGTGAGFMTIRNAGTTPDRLVAARCAAARVVELHTHVRDGDVMRMRPVPAIDLPAGQDVTLQPGGLHVMLIGLTVALVRGTQVPATLVFERAGEVEVQLAVEAAGARGPSHGH